MCRCILCMMPQARTFSLSGIFPGRAAAMARKFKGGLLMSDLDFSREHDAGCNLLGAGTDIPDPLCLVSAIVNEAFPDRVPDKVIAACGRLLIVWREANNG